MWLMRDLSLNGRVVLSISSHIYLYVSLSLEMPAAGYTQFHLEEYSALFKERYSI